VDRVPGDAPPRLLRAPQPPRVGARGRPALPGRQQAGAGARRDGARVGGGGSALGVGDPGGRGPRPPPPPRAPRAGGGGRARRRYRPRRRAPVVLQAPSPHRIRPRC
jgi:hypothetical protein